jgi:hypothetical protein
VHMSKEASCATFDNGAGMQSNDFCAQPQQDLTEGTLGKRSPPCSIVATLYHAAVAILPCSSDPCPRYPEYIFADAAGVALSSLPSTSPAEDMPLRTAKRRRQGFNPPLRIMPKS